MMFFGMTLLLIIYSSSIGMRNLFRYNRFSYDLENNLVKLKELQMLNHTYKNSLVKMDSDFYWEFLAKRDLGYVNKGESVVKFLVLK